MARTMRIDRFEGAFAICEGDGPGKEVKMYAIEVAELPPGAKEGMCCASATKGPCLLTQRKRPPAVPKSKKCRIPFGSDTLREASFVAFCKNSSALRGCFFFAKNVMLKKFCRKLLTFPKRKHIMNI